MWTTKTISVWKCILVLIYSQIIIQQPQLQSQTVGQFTTNQINQLQQELQGQLTNQLSGQMQTINQLTNQVQVQAINQLATGQNIGQVTHIPVTSQANMNQISGQINFDQTSNKIANQNLGQISTQVVNQTTSNQSTAQVTNEALSQLTAQASLNPVTGQINQFSNQTSTAQFTGQYFQTADGQPIMLQQLAQPSGDTSNGNSSINTSQNLQVPVQQSEYKQM